ncbi:hypothetical protein PIL02S_06472 [Paenibacillus illinoisensis]|uniref:Uncharacterized protein n=1 Tax=Paenibacillus illinoisensis TaxID=59845 RepID=A0A2W0C174_9BACL|nr:hypothetical protein PIL02S_06472 [Paenibacillus illinoisensis]
MEGQDLVGFWRSRRYKNQFFGSQWKNKIKNWIDRSGKQEICYHLEIAA